MPKDPRIKKVLVIGSGPIIIGQAAEFDYSGTQACRALKSEGIETVLVNSNPATIMTDPDIADHVYIEPLTAEVVERIIEKEKPDAILPNLGGQMGLNLSMELARSGFLDRSGVRLLACKPDTIDRAEDRQLFKDTMEKLNQPCIPSKVVEDLDSAMAFADVIGYPVIVRPAFTMGGTGGGICEDREKLHEIATNGLEDDLEAAQETLEDAQAELYAALARKLRAQVLADVDEKGLAKSQMSILDALLKLRQICCHPRLLKLDLPGFSNNLPSGKFDAFKDMVMEIVEGGHKVLVFSQFVQMLHIIRQWLEFSQVPFCYLDGASKDRFDQVDRFNNSPDIPIFLISLKAGGTGLNLTSADYVIHYDPWWNPAVESQATDRTHRIGQTRQVFSYKLICQNTVEEKILKLQEAKRGVAEAIIPGQDAWKSLTREDLEMLFEV